MQDNITFSSEDFRALRTILSTGSPLMPEHFDYVYHTIKADLCLSSISGGTDIISCFVLGNPILPVRRGEIQCRGLGMAVEIWNAQGQSVVNEKGELVCVKPFVSMPVCFWNDPDDEKYYHAYFDKFFGVWTHADYAMLIGISGIMIFGRSDAVLNPGGVRIGTAEIYRQVETLFPIQEALAIGLPHQDDIRIILFVILKQGHTLDAALIQTIKDRLRQHASPRHVPDLIIQVNDFPRTHNGKISELAVLKTCKGEDVDNKTALMNPEVLDYFKGIVKL
jgi:acetoacetyl-CoA synthetase